MAWVDVVLGAFVAIGLAAAAGLRVFVPLWVGALATLGGHLTPAPGFEWLGEPVVVGVLTVATVLEVGAFFVPWLDHALDALAAPAAVVAGGVLAGAFVGDVAPWLRWTLVAIAGGGAAGAVHLVAAGVRATSTALTGGLGSPAVASAEAGGSLLIAVLAVLAPAVAVVLLAGVAVGLARRFRLRSRK